MNFYYKLVLNLILLPIPLLNVYGAAIGSIACHVVGFTIVFNVLKKYVKLPDDLTAKQIAYDLTLKTVEVEDVINIKDKFLNSSYPKAYTNFKNGKYDKYKLIDSDDLFKLIPIVSEWKNN